MGRIENPGIDNEDQGIGNENQGIENESQRIEMRMKIIKNMGMCLEKKSGGECDFGPIWENIPYVPGIFS